MLWVAIVVGGGNIFRGSSWAGSTGLDWSSADYMGMLATVMNAIFFKQQWRVLASQQGFRLHFACQRLQNHISVDGT
ncbi:hypothetical protein POPTR_007G110301v4 [Populus trichocarpa]|uniref:Uncharacterized protein n=1 Tax=Populus trichocarpa TaxID=3694 RepID=A0ACC0SRK0_POPTR|nr:hypothetical protein POPTR_007G110301v4 [Populus trichocarpa]